MVESVDGCTLRQSEYNACMWFYAGYAGWESLDIHAYHHTNHFGRVVILEDS
jgi:hypothetical protein